MKKQTGLFLVVTVITVCWMFVMRPITPPNIVAFEFARTVDNAITIFMQWGISGVEKAKMSLYFDFVFLVLYSWAISLGCKVVAQYVNIPRLAKTGALLARVIWVAAACDFIENVSLLMAIQEMHAGLMELAFWMAGIKFTIVGIALLFIIIGTFSGLLNRFFRTREA
ncbi:MAG: hypothetical protein KIT62_03500 [Cyclobacteriaceae bacterium]|nr:hypothetical protein [Cyclobacteriaceae bacterium]